LRAKEAVIIKLPMFVIEWLWCSSIIIAERRIIEARDCTKKYFSADSVIRWLLVFEVSGIKDRRLISNPTQAPYQEVDDTEINDPNNVNININILGLVSIRKRRVKV